MSVNKHAPQRIEISVEEIKLLLERTKSVHSPEDHATFVHLAESYVLVTSLLQQKDATIQRLRNLVFGSKSEKRRNIVPEAEQAAALGSAGETAEKSAAADAAGSEESATKPEPKPKPKRKGHGRNGAEQYEGAEHIHVAHPSMKPGDACPEPGCTGKVYAFEPLVIVKVVGQAPLGATVTNVEQLRCNLCLKVFPACSREALGTEKYDPSAGSMIAVLTYGAGMPFNRLAALQKNLKVPLPPSTQWDIVAKAAKLVEPAYGELIREAAQGDVIHNDDTPMKILEYLKRKETTRDVG